MAPEHRECEQVSSCMVTFTDMQGSGFLGVGPRGADLTGLQLCLVRAAVFKPRAGTAELENKAHGCVALRIADLT